MPASKRFRVCLQQVPLRSLRFLPCPPVALAKVDVKNLRAFAPLRLCVNFVSKSKNLV